MRPALEMIATALLSALALGCTPPPPEMIVYCAVPKDRAESVLQAFTEQTHVAAQARYADARGDQALLHALGAAPQSPQVDVFWTDDILQILMLDREGKLAPYAPPIAANYPPAFRSADGRWHGFAAVARVIVINPSIMPADKRPQGLADLANPFWAQGVGMARPNSGSSAVHAAALFATHGQERTQAFFRDLKENEVQFFSTEDLLVQAVASGKIAMGLTDSSAVIRAIEAGLKVEMIYPDQGPDQTGTMFVPQAVGIIANCEHPAHARQLVETLLSPQTELALAKSPSAFIPLNEQITEESRVKGPTEVRPMAVDFPKVLEAWPAAFQFLQETFNL